MDPSKAVATIRDAGLVIGHDATASLRVAKAAEAAAGLMSFGPGEPVPQSPLRAAMLILKLVDDMAGLEFEAAEAEAVMKAIDAANEVVAAAQVVTVGKARVLVDRPRLSVSAWLGPDGQIVAKAAEFASGFTVVNGGEHAVDVLLVNPGAERGLWVQKDDGWGFAVGATPEQAAEFFGAGRQAEAPVSTLGVLPSTPGMIGPILEVLSKMGPVAVSKPFAGYADFDACVVDQKAKGHSDEAAHNICGYLKAETEKAITEKAASPVARGGVRWVQKAGGEEHFVLGVVLEPDVVDTQGDTYDAPTVRKAAHDFMEHFGNMGEVHQKLANDKLTILESYVSLADQTYNGQVIKAGTWMLGARVKDDEMWAKVKAGEYTGWSIGGYATKTPIQ